MEKPPVAGHRFLVERGRALSEALPSDKDAADARRKAIGLALTDDAVRLVKAVSPALIVQVGAHEASLSLRLKAESPDARVIAFEAHPRIHARYAGPLAKQGVESVHAAAGPTDAPAQLHVPVQDGRERISMGSLLRYGRAGTFQTYDVDGVRLDTVLGAAAASPNVLWLDVGGAAREVLQGAARLLDHALLVHARVEDTPLWGGQGTASDVVEMLAPFGLTPVARDIDKGNVQYNLLFVNREKVPDALLKDFAGLPAQPSPSASGTAPVLPSRAFEHVVSTRFGIGITAPDWYAYRLPLLEATVYASLKNQTVKAFSWRLMVDHRLSRGIMRSLERLRSTFPQMSIVAVNEILAPSFQLGHEPDGWVLTSRIDDDDALASDTFERLHERAGRYLSDRPDADALFTFPVGIEFDTIASTFGEFRFPCHSMSVHVLSRKAARTCFSQSHTKYKDYAEASGMSYEELETAVPKWLYLRHKLVDSNLHKVREHEPIDDRFMARIQQDFGIDLNALRVFRQRQDEVSFAGHRGTRKLEERRLLVRELRPLVKHIQNNVSRNELDVALVEKYNQLIIEYQALSNAAMP